MYKSIVVKKKIIKKDYNRILLTDTQPYEMPVIIGNEGFYNHLCDHEVSIDRSNLICKIYEKFFYSGHEPKVPYLYEIKKTDTSFRQLALIHPSNQVAVRNLYAEYGALILKGCEKSKYSLRKPSKIASSYYMKHLGGNESKIKNDSVETSDTTKYNKYASSYFAYSRYSFLRVFLESKQIFDLESSFSKQRVLDVANCFGSIYSHSISWAFKNKSLVKKIISKGTPDGGFDVEFDRVMQKCNINETNGIVIGPEFSRIFAELIFQEIDDELYKRLDTLEIKFGDDYSICRYVDDYYIFFNNITIANKIEVELDRLLREFKLSLNLNKKHDYDRPFVTSNSLARLRINSFLDNEFSHLLAYFDKAQDNVLSYAKGLSRQYIFKLRCIIHETGITYEDAAKIILYRVRLFLLNGLRSSAIKDDDGKVFVNKELTFRTIIFLMSDMSLFFYKQERRVRASYLICQITIECFQKIEEMNEYGSSKEYVDELKFQLSTFYSEGISMLIDSCSDKVDVEICNLLILLKHFSSEYTVNDSTLRAMINMDDLDYFTIISLLYFMKDYPDSNQLKERLCKKIVKFFSTDSSSIREPQLNEKVEESELLHLWCDFISYPTVKTKYKETIVKDFLQSVVQKKLNTEEVEEIITHFSTGYWFTNWAELDFRKALRKKELNPVY